MRTNNQRAGGFRVRRAALLAAAIAAGATAGGCLPTGGIVIRPAPADETLNERTLTADPGWFVRDKVLILDVEGDIMNAAGAGLLGRSENPVSLFMEKVEAAQSDPDVKALVLRVDSPGGTVVGSQLMYDALLRLKKAKEAGGKTFPIIAMFMGTAASGGYYIAMAADEIIALPTTVTGSIGVIMLMPNVGGLMEKLGVEMKAVKSRSRKDAGSPFRKMTTEEEQYFQDEIVGRYYKQFLDVVAKNRTKMSRDKLMELADGRVMLGEAAAECGLVDKVGSLEDALARAAKLAGLTAKRVVVYGRPLEWKNSIYATAPAGGATASGATVNLFNLSLDRALLPTPGFYYMWQAGGH